jgi:hypothetical protein
MMITVTKYHLIYMYENIAHTVIYIHDLVFVKNKNV